MRTSQVLSLAAPVLSLTLALNVPQAQAQESLAGVGAAGAMGATLGAAATTNIVPSQVTRGINGNTNAAIDEAGDPSGRGGSSMGESGAGAAAPPPAVPPPLASQSASGEELLGQLLSKPFRAIPETVHRTPRQQAAYARKLQKMTPAQRKRMVAQKYQIAPVNYYANYLPEDRYKFGRAWKFVSTETDRYYYTPQDMARHKFNANRVIGFRTWQDAMLAGYRPDPATRPSPGHELAFFASLTRDKPLIDTVEYAYAGQITPANMDATYNYVRRVKATADAHPAARKYEHDTFNQILNAFLVGDLTLIPTQFGAPVVVKQTTTQGSEGMSSSSSLGSSSSMGSSKPGGSPLGSPRG